MAVDRIVERKDAAICEDHDRRCGIGLPQRAGAIRRVGSHGLGGHEIGQPKSRLPDQRSPVRQRNIQSRRPARRHDVSDMIPQRMDQPEPAGLIRVQPFENCAVTRSVTAPPSQRIKQTRYGDGICRRRARECFNRCVVRLEVHRQSDADRPRCIDVCNAIAWFESRLGRVINLGKPVNAERIADVLDVDGQCPVLVFDACARIEYPNRECFHAEPGNWYPGSRPRARQCSASLRRRSRYNLRTMATHMRHSPNSTMRGHRAVPRYCRQG